MNKTVPSCSCNVIHTAIVEDARAKMPPEDQLYDLADLFKVFGDSTRIRILYALSSNPMCVCDIAALLGMTQSAISHQLRILKSARLVKNRKEGKVVFYTLIDDHVRMIFAQGLEHVRE